MSIAIEYRAVGLAEADHRIANNLASLSSILRLQRSAISKCGSGLTSDEVCMLLDDIGARIEVMAKLHRSLAQNANGNGVNLGDFLQEISELIGALGSPGRMNLTVDNACDGLIDPRHALHAGLVTAELLTNAGKYAHPTGLTAKVHIRCETSDDGCFLVEVSDDGIGFPENFDPSTNGGLGFQLMRALANGLDAELEFEHGPLGVCGRLVRRKRLLS